MTTHRPSWILLAIACATAALLSACQPSQKERRHIGGKGKRIQLTWEEEQLRLSDRSIDREGNPPPLTDCEERAWINRRALNIPASTVQFTEETGDAISNIGQYSFRKRAGYGGSVGAPNGYQSFFAVIPDFSPMYFSDHKLCDESRSMRGSNGQVIDGSSCRRYEVVDGVASLASISMTCIDRGNPAAGLSSNVDRYPDMYWPAKLVDRIEDVFYSPYESGDYSVTKRAWSTLSPRPRPELGLMEWTSDPDRTSWPDSRKNLYGATYYTPLEGPTSWHLGQPTVFVCSAPFDSATPVQLKVTCQGPAFLGASFVGPGMTATMIFPLKFLPQWRELTAGFTNFVTSYQTSGRAAPPAALPAPSTISSR